MFSCGLCLPADDDVDEEIKNKTSCDKEIITIYCFFKFTSLKLSVKKDGKHDKPSLV